MKAPRFIVHSASGVRVAGVLVSGNQRTGAIDLVDGESCFRFYSNDALALPVLYQLCRAALAETSQFT